MPADRQTMPSPAPTKQANERDPEPAHQNHADENDAENDRGTEIRLDERQDHQRPNDHKRHPKIAQSNSRAPVRRSENIWPSPEQPRA